MRSWSFTFENEEDAKKAFVGFQKMFKDCEDFEKRKIFYCSMKDKDKTYKIFLGIEDTVAGAFTITTMNAFDKCLKNVFTVTKADCKDIKVEFPENCKISSWWEADKVPNKSKEETKDGKTN